MGTGLKSWMLKTIFGIKVKPREYRHIFILSKGHNLVLFIQAWTHIWLVTFLMRSCIILGPPFPAEGTWSGKMITSPDGNGIIFLAMGVPYDYYEGGSPANFFYHLKMNSDGDFEWIIMKQKLKVQSRYMFLMDYIDESEVYCYPETTPSTIATTPTTYTGPPKIGTLF